MIQINMEKPNHCLHCPMCNGDDDCVLIQEIDTSWDWEEQYANCPLQEVEPETNWISVSEKLPEEDGDYLVTFEEGYAEDYGLDLVGIAPYEVDCEGFGIWQEEFDLHTLGSLGSEWVDINVIAWQPLPEKFKEEGGEE